VGDVDPSQIDKFSVVHILKRKAGICSLWLVMDRELLCNCEEKAEVRFCRMR
jgi:hypothetical protein